MYESKTLNGKYDYPAVARNFQSFVNGHWNPGADSRDGTKFLQAKSAHVKVYKTKNTQKWLHFCLIKAPLHWSPSSPPPPPSFPSPLPYPISPPRIAFCWSHLNFVPRVFSAFKMAPRRRPWQTADHVSTNYPITKPAAILKQSKSPIFSETCDLLFARIFSEPPF